MKFFVVQPYGRHKAIESTIVAEAGTADAAFAEIDRLAERMRRTGVLSDSIELLVVDEHQRIVPRRVN